jgi:polysaccharide deacetylase family protein (PEP-CTERM system associated)
MNILTFDIEHWYEGYRYRGIDGWQAYPPRDDRVVGKLLDALAASEQRATLFFTGRYAAEFPQIVKRSVAEGHEIGSHSYEHAVLPELADLRAFRADLVKSIGQLESVGGVKVRGYRAPKWSISDRSRAAVLRILLEEGLEYDSSFFPAVFGTPRERAVPHQVTLGGGTLWEIPATTYPLFGLRLPAAGGLYFRAFPEWITHRVLSTETRPRIHPGMIYLHPYDLDADCPRLPGGGIFNRVRYIGVDSAWKRLETILRKFRFCPAVEWLGSHSRPRLPGM